MNTTIPKKKTGIETVRKEFLTACEKSGITKEQIRVDGMAGSGYQDWFIRKKEKKPILLLRSPT
ncbi:MAG: hypothetical protein IPL22_19960 [Bacteroidetes bacterium]|nr:hypothetical protein [Bacteroidota bacterium]